MVSKIVKGKSFMGAVKYVMGKEKSRYLVGTLAGRSPESIGEEIRVFNRVASHLGQRKPVFHESINLAQGERLSDREWEYIVKEHMKAMGFDGAPWVAVRHGDRKHDHVHVVALRVSPGHKTIQVDWDYERAAKHLLSLSREFGLKEVKTHRMNYMDKIQGQEPSL